MCQVEGCNKPAHSRGWCPKHYSRWYRTGNPEAPDGRFTRGICSIGDCDKLHHAKGLCENHYRQENRESGGIYQCTNCGGRFEAQRKRWTDVAYCSQRCKNEVRVGTAEGSMVARRHNYKRKYGITVDDYEAMRDAQDGCCFLCATDQPNGRVSKHTTDYWLHVDHDHLTGQIRSLLCANCNTAIGKMNDDPDLLRRAADYIEAAR